MNRAFISKMVETLTEAMCYNPTDFLIAYDQQSCIKVCHMMLHIQTHA